jgi:hypothetical protein
MVPKSVNNRGYSLFYFEGAGEAYSDSDELCSDMKNNDRAVKSKTVPFQVLHQADGNPIVRFNQEITSCKTGVRSLQTLEFTWQNGGFTKTLDEKHALMPGSNK